MSSSGPNCNENPGASSSYSRREIARINKINNQAIITRCVSEPTKRLSLLAVVLVGAAVYDLFLRTILFHKPSNASLGAIEL